MSALPPFWNKKRYTRFWSEVGEVTNSHTQSKIHLVADRDHAGRDVLSGIAHDGDQDQTDKGAAEDARLDDGLDALYEVVGAERYHDGGADQNQGGGPPEHVGLVILFPNLTALGFLVRDDGAGGAVNTVGARRAVDAVGTLGLCLGNKQVLVRVELEPQVEAV